MDSEVERKTELWRHWVRMPAWSMHESSALLSGIIPSENWTYDQLKNGRCTFGPELDQKYFRLLDVFARADDVWELNFPCKKARLLEWVGQNKINIPEALTEALSEIGQAPANDKYAKAKISPSVNSSRTSPNKLTTRERDSFLYLIATMAVKNYRYLPSVRNSAVSQLIREMEDLGIEPLSKDTIRGKLNEACELIPQSSLTKVSTTKS